MRMTVAAVALVAAAAGSWYALSSRGASATQPPPVVAAPAGDTLAPGNPPDAKPGPLASEAVTGSGRPATAVAPPAAPTEPRPTSAPPPVPGTAAKVAGAATDSTATPPSSGASINSAAASAARRELDSVRAMLASPESGEEEARAAIPRLQRILRDLGTASDSTWAYLALVSAMGQAGEGQRACNYLRSARRLASSDLQLRAVQNFFASEALACVP